MTPLRGNCPVAGFSSSFLIFLSLSFAFSYSRLEKRGFHRKLKRELEASRVPLFKRWSCNRERFSRRCVLGVTCNRIHDRAGCLRKIGGRFCEIPCRDRSCAINAIVDTGTGPSNENETWVVWENIRSPKFHSLRCKNICRCNNSAVYELLRYY